VPLPLPLPLILLLHSHSHSQLTTAQSVADRSARRRAERAATTAADPRPGAPRTHHRQGHRSIAPNHLQAVPQPYLLLCVLSLSLTLFFLSRTCARPLSLSLCMLRPADIGRSRTITPAGIRRLPAAIRTLDLCFRHAHYSNTDSTAPVSDFRFFFFCVYFTCPLP
jgi:hypothetical protein